MSDEPKPTDVRDMSDEELTEVLRVGGTAEPILQVFRFAHLREDLKAVSRPFAQLAIALVRNLPRNPERTVALRKLREAKDCAVTAQLWE